MKIKMVAVGGLIALLLPALPAKAAPGDSVSVQACARAGAEANCLVITGADGAVYNITSAKPKPPLDVMIQLRGTVTDKLSACNQGLVLDNITWTPTQEKCAN
jgi:hypothetical protein